MEPKELYESFEQIGRKRLAIKILNIMTAWNGENDTDLVVAIRNLCKEASDEEWIH